ncbi:MAG: hypothetical protein ACREQQ_10610 [Candidatus Binatia bacterium]
MSCLGLSAAAAYPIQIPFFPNPLDAEGRVELEHVERVEEANPSQDPRARLRLRFGGDVTSRFRLQTDVTGTAGGTPRHARGAGVYDLDHVLQDISPSLEIGEAYVEYYSSAIELRAGLQRFAWGKLDGIQPNDILNPEKFYDPILEDEHDRKIGVPALAPTAYLPRFASPWIPSDLRVTGVWQPIFVPYYFPDVDERWYPPLARVPPETRVLGFTTRNQTRFRNRPLPSRTLDHGTVAVRLTGLFSSVDFGLYYFDGYDTAPTLDVSARGFVRLNPANPERFDVRAEIDVFPVFGRVRAAGFDLAYSMLGATFRGEAAYVMDRGYPRSIRDVVAEPQQIGTLDTILLFAGGEQAVPVALNPANVRRDGIEWGFGGDTLWGETFVLAQMNQTVVLRNDVDLLISDIETRLAVTVRRSFLADKLKTELVGLYGLQGVYGLAHPRLTFSVNDHVDVRVGYVLIAGHETSFLGQYRANDQGYVRARVLF